MDNKHNKNNKKIYFVLAGVVTVIVIAIIAIASIMNMPRQKSDVKESFSAVDVTQEIIKGTVKGTTEGAITETTDTSTQETTQQDTQSDASNEPEATTHDAQPDNSETPDDEPEDIDYSEEGIKKYSVAFNKSWKYGSFSAINSGSAVMYENTRADANGIVVCVNAGHGTNGGTSVKTQCHPDGSPKVTGGSTASGATMATAVSSGMTFLDGTPEASVTLRMAQLLKQELINNGYSVLMVRDAADVQLDNVARTVMANNKADCHISLHWDSTQTGKGAFYIGVPDVDSYRSMEPVASNWEKHESLGRNLVSGLESNGVSIHGTGRMAIDLTQTSYSTIPSVDLELGDKASDHSDAALKKLAKGIRIGLDNYY